MLLRREAPVLFPSVALCKIQQQVFKKYMMDVYYVNGVGDSPFFLSPNTLASVDESPKFEKRGVEMAQGIQN
jgi:hypothetical protein